MSRTLLVLLSAAVTAACGSRTGLAVDDRDLPIDVDGGEPLPPPPPPPAVRAIQVITGTHHACVLDEAGAIRCWGNNRYGELGLDESVEQSPHPVAVRGLPEIRALAAGHAVNFAIDHEGRIWGWGSNAWSGLLLPDDVARAQPRRISPFGMPPATEVIAGDGYGCAVVETGDLQCWGSVIWRTRGGLLVPETVLRDVRSAAGGGGHVCGIHDDGAARCWGHNQRREIGAGLPTDVPAPVRLPGLDRVDALTLGLFHSCARLGGAMQCWGSNVHGQSGASEEDTLPPTRVDGLPERVSMVSAGWTSSCAITSSGRAWCWGANVWGQLGDGTRMDSRVPVEVRLPSGVEVRQIAGGSNFACAVDTDGRVWCWGENGRGQLGDGTVRDRPIPAPVAL